MDEPRRLRLSALLAELAAELQCENDDLTERPASNGTAVVCDRMRLTTAKAWQRASAVRRRIFEHDDSLFADPGWDILLDLYVERVERRSVTVSSACIAANVPTTTGLRWLERLHRRGLITRTPDARDGRKVYIGLTDIAVEKITASIDAAVGSDRKLGLGRLELLQ
jgi:hypothetical protein